MSDVLEVPRTSAASAAGVGTASPHEPMCYVIDQAPGARAAIASVLDSIKVKFEHFDSLPLMLERYAAARPNLIMIDVTVSTSEACRYLEILTAAGVDRPICIMSGLNGLLTEELRRRWQKRGLTMRPVLAKPLRQQAIKQSAIHLVERSAENPRISIRDVIEQGWFELWYQPRIDLNSKILAGAEGLFRARHPTLGMISASELLENAAEDDLLKLTTRVLGRAMSDWKSFRGIGVPIQFSINIPTCALKKLSLFSIFWEQAPNAADWPGVTLELNEDDIIPNMPFAFAAIKELHKQKISLAIDSFALSYDELSRHQELPFSEIKIDRSLVCSCDIDPLNAGLCETIIEFAHRFHAKVVAEGVETPGELKALRNMGCDFAQGYLLARPMSKADFLAVLQQRSPKAAASRPAGA
jgi:EAL domain-containing protein (putative c-di-GMP-specific phosphodiesterase class I)